MNLFMASEAAVRECDCDELMTGIVRACAHFNGEILRLDDYGEDPPYQRFVVYLFEAETEFYAGRDAGAAIRAYFDAQKQLLRCDDNWRALETF